MTSPHSWTHLDLFAQPLPGPGTDVPSSSRRAGGGRHARQAEWRHQLLGQVARPHSHARHVCATIVARHASAKHL